TDALATSKAPPNYAQRADARLGELEDRWRRTVDVTIHEPHLGAHVTSGVSRKSCHPPRAIVPTQAGQADTPRISSHQEWCVGGTSHGRKCGCNRRELSFVTQSGERGQLTAVNGVSENIRPHSIGYYHHHLRTITWRALCRRTQL